MNQNTKKLFLEELKSEYDSQFQLINSLEAKSGQLITVCGIVIPLLFGFSSLLIDKIDSNYTLVVFLEILLVITLSLTAASIFFCVMAIRIQSYRHSFLPDIFYDKNGNIVEKEIAEFATDEDDFYDTMINEYLESNKQNITANENKAKKIVLAQYLFLGGLAIVPILVGISFIFTTSRP